MYPLFGHTLTSLYPSIIQSLTRPSQVRRTANSDWTKIEQTMNVASYPLVVDSSWTLHYNIATYAHAHDFSTCWENIDSKVGKLKGRHGVMDKEWDACWESEVKWSQDVGKLLVWVINGENGDNPWEFCGENIDLLPTFTLSHKGCPAPRTPCTTGGKRSCERAFAAGWASAAPSSSGTESAASRSPTLQLCYRGT